MSSLDQSLFEDDAWRLALEKYAAVSQLAVVLYDQDARTVGTPISSNRLQAVFQEYAYQPGVFDDCARACLAQDTPRPGVIMQQTNGLAVVGTPLVLEAQMAGAVVAGYALVEFCHSSTIELLARRANVPFQKLWDVVQQTRPIPQHRLGLQGELLQILGNTVLQQVVRTRHFQATAANLEARVKERTRDLAVANESLERELRDREQTELRARQLLTRLVTVQEEERRRIARDVHDNLGQQMVALRLKLDILQMHTDTPGWQNDLRQVQDLVRQLDQDLVSFTRELRPPLLEQFGFVEALRSFVGDWSRTHGIPGTLEEFGIDALQLSPSVEIHLLRVVQEALNNVYKHARATDVEVGLHAQHDRLVLTVADNGAGIDLNAQASDNARSGTGLLGMRERVWSMHGEFEIDARPGKGTTVIVTVPIGGGVLIANE